MAAFPWQAKPGVHKKLAWLAWLTIMAFFVIASLITIWGAVQQRARPVRVTFFDKTEKVILPDVQICLVDGNRGASEGDVTPQTGYRRVSRGDFVLGALDRAILLDNGQSLPPKYNITIESSLAGIAVDPDVVPLPGSKNGYSYSGKCDPDVTTTVRSRFVPPNMTRTGLQAFDYMTKTDEGLFFQEPELFSYFYGDPSQGPDFPYVPTLDFTRRSLSIDLDGDDGPDAPTRGYLSPSGVLGGNPEQVHSLSGMVIGVNPYIGCLTFFASLCSEQEQDFLSEVPAPIIISLTGTGPKFKYFQVSIGQQVYDDPLSALDVNTVQQKAFLNSTLNLVVAPQYNRPLLSLSELLRIKEPPVFSRYSYSLGSVLPTSDQGEASGNGTEPVNFTFTLEVSLSPKGVEHAEAQDPLFGVFGTIGGLWNFVPLLFGLLYAATPKESDVLHPTN